MSKKSFEDYYDIVLKISVKGFLTVASDERINTMTIGWGSLGHLWETNFYDYGEKVPLYLSVD